MALNYDAWGEEFFTWMIRHPACDRAVALAVYWCHAPGYFARYANREEAQSDPNSKAWDLLREIEAGFMAGKFANSHLAFDPRNNPVPMGTLQPPGWDCIAMYDFMGRERNPLPDIMKQPVSGRQVDVIDGFPDWIEGIPPSVWAELEELECRIADELD